MANSLTFGGVDLSDSTYGVTVVEGPVDVLSEPRLSTTERNGDHGSIVRGNYIKARTLTIPVVMEGTSYADLLVKVDALRALFLPGADQYLALDTLPGRQIKCRLSKTVSGKLYGGRALEMDLEFVAGDPIWYGTTLRTRTTTTNTFTDWDVSFSGTPYAGTVDTPISFIGRQGPSADSQSASVYVSNSYTPHTSTSNQWGIACSNAAVSMGYYHLGASQYVKFDSDLETISVSMDAVTWISVMQYRSIYLTSSSRTYPFMTRALLHPGENLFLMAGCTGVGYSWTYTYYDRWL